MKKNLIAELAEKLVIAGRCDVITAYKVAEDWHAEGLKRGHIVQMPRSQMKTWSIEKRPIRFKEGT